MALTARSKDYPLSWRLVNGATPQNDRQEHTMTPRTMLTAIGATAVAFAIAIGIAAGSGSGPTTPVSASAATAQATLATQRMAAPHTLLSH